MLGLKNRKGYQMRNKEQIMVDIKLCEKTIRCRMALLRCEMWKEPEISAQVDSYDRELNDDEKVNQSIAKSTLENLEKRITKAKKNLKDAQKQYEKVVDELVRCFYENVRGHALEDYVD